MHLLTILSIAALAFAGTLMVNRDLRPNIDIVQSIVPAVYTATATGTGADLQGYDSAMAELDVGALAGAGLFTVTVEESDTLGSGYSTVAAAQLNGAFVTPVANSIQRVGYLGAKRFIRVVATYVSGTSLAFSAQIVRGTPNTRALP